MTRTFGKRSRVSFPLVPTANQVVFEVCARIDDLEEKINIKKARLTKIKNKWVKLKKTIAKLEDELGEIQGFRFESV